MNEKGFAAVPDREQVTEETIDNLTENKGDCDDDR